MIPIWNVFKDRKSNVLPIECHVSYVLRSVFCNESLWYGSLHKFTNIIGRLIYYFTTSFLVEMIFIQVAQIYVLFLEHLVEKVLRRVFSAILLMCYNLVDYISLLFDG